MFPCTYILYNQYTLVSITRNRIVYQRGSILVNKYSRYTSVNSTYEIVSLYEYVRVPPSDMISQTQKFFCEIQTFFAMTSSEARMNFARQVRRARESMYGGDTGVEQ